MAAVAAAHGGHASHPSPLPRSCPSPLLFFPAAFSFFCTCVFVFGSDPVRCHAPTPPPPFFLVSDEQLGYTATYIIGTLSLPGFIFLFYAAIKKGKAEVEEDDAKFGKGRW